ncbi:hypothetical protein D3C72_1708600 [compost metagenome]
MPGAVANRVVQNVLQHDRQRVFIARHRQRQHTGLGPLHGDVDVAPIRDPQAIPHRLFGHDTPIDRATKVRVVGTVQPGHDQQLRYQPVQPFHPATNALLCLAFCSGVLGTLHDIPLGPYCRQGRAQLVGGVRRQAPLLFDQRSDARQQAVHRVRKNLQFARYLRA